MRCEVFSLVLVDSPHPAASPSIAQKPWKKNRAAKHGKRTRAALLDLPLWPSHTSHMARPRGSSPSTAGLSSASSCIACRASHPEISTSSPAAAPANWRLKVVALHTGELFNLIISFIVFLRRVGGGGGGGVVDGFWASCQRNRGRRKPSYKFVALR